MKIANELQRVENEVDLYYKSNSLVNFPFTTAVWSLLTFAEFKILQDENRQLTSQEQEMMGNNFVNELKYPVSWLFGTCKQGGQIPSTYDDKVFQASWDLFRLGKKYQWFEAAYIYHRRGWIELELQGSTIQPIGDLFTEMEYQAYGRLIQAHQSDEVLSLINPNDYPIEAIGHSLKIQGDRFHYNLNPRMVSDTISAMKPAFGKMFLLPSRWPFSRYALGDFQKVAEAILAVASIHAAARKIAADLGCVGMVDSIYMPTCSELLRRIVRYSGVSDTKVQNILDDLTYGNRGIKHPDPALQPLIKLNAKHYAIIPHLWLLLNPERNLTVLFNRFPSERKIYAELVDEKEDLMRKHFTANLSDKDFKFICGNVAKLPDIDLAIVDDSEKACLLLELKWFIAPAEFREVVEKSEEIKKGIDQSLKLKEAFRDSHEPLLKKLGIDVSYRLETIVVSQNWIGEANVQNPEVPVIRADHLIARLKATESLRSTMDWLKNREYLPKEGKDFEVHGITSKIGKWSLKWSTTRPLIENAFFPV